MLEFLGENYYIDLDEIEKSVSYEPLIKEGEEGTEEIKEQQISLTKWEVIKIMLDVVLSESDTVDEKLGRHSSNDLTIPFKLAFNTLLINKVMKKL
jgi:hypothetical protein